MERPTGTQRQEGRRMPGILFSVQQAVLMRDALAGPQETMCVYVRSYTAVASVGEKKDKQKSKENKRKRNIFPM